MSVVHSTAAGIAPKQIIASMKAENPDIHANTKVIYNLKTRIRAAYLDGRTSVQALLDFLAEKSYTVAYRTENGKLTHLFLAHPQSVKMAKLFPSMFLLDCTYKTNKFGLPLLNIAGFSSVYKTFTACSVFLRSETIIDYTWALQQFRKMVMPIQRCW